MLTARWASALVRQESHARRQFSTGERTVLIELFQEWFDVDDFEAGPGAWAPWPAWARTSFLAACWDNPTRGKLIPFLLGDGMPPRLIESWCRAGPVRLKDSTAWRDVRTQIEWWERFHVRGGRDPMCVNYVRTHYCFHVRECRWMYLDFRPRDLQR